MGLTHVIGVASLCSGVERDQTTVYVRTEQLN